MMIIVLSSSFGSLSSCFAQGQGCSPESYLSATAVGQKIKRIIKVMYENGEG